MQDIPDNWEDIAPEAEAKDAAPSPVRVLVSTHTHLVPGEGYQRKMAAMRCTIAEHVLKTDFDQKKDRMEVYNPFFAVPGHHCFFLFDHASSPVGDDVADQDIPLLWYRWTGGKLIALNQAPPREIRRRIKSDYPFRKRMYPPKIPGDEKLTREEIKMKRMKETPEDREKRRRELVRSHVRMQAHLHREAYDWLAQNPDQEAWLKDNIEPAAWSWYEKIKDEYFNGPPWAED